MRIVVAGSGRVGLGLARLLSGNGRKVCVVDPGEDGRPAFAGQVVKGFPLDRGVLEQAGLEEADALAAVFDSDALNVAVGLLARKVFRVPRVVVRVNQPHLAEAVNRLGLVPLSPLAWAVRRFADLLCRGPVETVASLGAQADLAEVQVPSHLAGRCLGDLQVVGELQPVALTRGERTWLAESGLRLEEGDRLHVALRGSGKERLQDWLVQP